MSSYNPISPTEFRIIHLLPGTFDSSIQCVLEIRDCEVKTQYEALSYQWGAESLFKPTIQLAHLARQQKTSTCIEEKKEGGPRRGVVARGLQRVFEVIWQLIRRYYAGLRLGLVVAAILFLCQKVPPLLLESTAESPEYILGVIPRDWSTAFICISWGYISVVACEYAALLIAETMKIKPWLLVNTLPYFRSLNDRFETSATLAWETVPVTPNLERALRYLRLEKQHRALWIDALCINQQDDAEKRIQIERMDFLYANASAVRIWLGDYHGISDSAPCESIEASGTKSSPCQHQREICEAFGFMRASAGMRILIPSFLTGRSLDQHMEDTMPGLLAIARREYWQRLWVVQEAALGTGPVNMQCGHEVCDLEGILAAQHRAVIRENVPREVSEAFECGRRFAVTWQEFRYSPFHDHGLNRGTAKLIYKGTTGVMRYIFPSMDDEPTSFHDRPYSHRLLHVLLRVSGYFHCRDERDRLYAVLGVVGGVEKGDRQMANTVEFFHSQNFQTMFGLFMDQWLKAKLGDGTRSVALRYLLGGLVGSWCVFFDAKARYWSINRPKYIMTNHTNHDELSREIGETSVGESQGKGGEFFHKLVIYLANETKSLSFLDAMSFDDQPVNKASWVPCWQAKVDDEAYKFLVTRRDGDTMPRDTFRFLDDGKTLEILGMGYGCVDEVKNVDPAVLDSDPDQVDLDQLDLDKNFILPSDIREAFVQVREAIVKLRQAFPSSDPAMKRLLHQDEVLAVIKTTLETSKGLLARHGRAVLQYSSSSGSSSGSDSGNGSNKTTDPAFIKAGEAKKGDRVVFVPGCYHQLVLRKVPNAKCSSRPYWKLVGLVITVNIAMHGRKKGGVSGVEWETLQRYNSLKRFAIV